MSNEINKLHGTYVGSIVELQGKTALLRPDPLLQPSKWWLAQFDDTELKHGKLRLGFGWHHTLLKDWKIDDQQPAGSTPASTTKEEA